MEDKNEVEKRRAPWWRRRKETKTKTNQSVSPSVATEKSDRRYVETLDRPANIKQSQTQAKHQNRSNRSQNASKKRSLHQRPPQKRGNYAFIDSQNLNLGVQKAGWKMDWHRFREWLRQDYGVTHAYMFIGYMSENEDLYDQMHAHGFLVVLKPTNEIMIVEKPGDKSDKDKEKTPVKGNIDADLVLYAMKEQVNYHQAIIVSGDGDFFSLAEYLESKGKLLKIMTPNSHFSMLLKPFEKKLLNLDHFKRDLRYFTARKK